MGGLYKYLQMSKRISRVDNRGSAYNAVRPLMFLSWSQTSSTARIERLVVV